MISTILSHALTSENGTKLDESKAVAAEVFRLAQDGRLTIEPCGDNKLKLTCIKPSLYGYSESRLLMQALFGNKQIPGSSKLLDKGTLPVSQSLTIIAKKYVYKFPRTKDEQNMLINKHAGLKTTLSFALAAIFTLCTFKGNNWVALVVGFSFVWIVASALIMSATSISVQLVDFIRSLRPRLNKTGKELSRQINSTKDSINNGNATACILLLPYELLWTTTPPCIKNGLLNTKPDWYIGEWSNDNSKIWTRISHVFDILTTSLSQEAGETCYLAGVVDSKTYKELKECTFSFVHTPYVSRSDCGDSGGYDYGDYGDYGDCGDSGGDCGD